MPHRVPFAVGGFLGLLLLGTWLDGLPVDIRADDSIAGRSRGRGPLVRLEHPVAIEGGEVRVGGSTVRFGGRLGPGPRFVGTDLRIDAAGPDLSEIAALIPGHPSLPAERYEVAGRVRVVPDGYELEAVEAQVGDIELRLHGRVGLLPELEGTALDVRAAGPNLEPLGKLTDLLPLPVGPFELSGHVDGTAGRLTLREVSARLGQSDLTGSLELDVRGIPHVTGELSSERIDLTARPGAGQVEEGERAAREGDRAIPDAPLELGALQTANVDVRWTAAEVMTEPGRLGNVKLVVSLRDGRLRLDPVSAEHVLGRTLRGRLSLEPVGAAYRVHARLTGKRLRVDAMNPEDDPDLGPPLDFELEFEGVGPSLHAIASVAGGRLIVVQGRGRLDRLALDRLTADIAMSLLDALNPFARERRYTEMECAVLVASLENGVVTIDPIAARTERMTVVGRGAVDLGTEQVDLVWASRPRRGFGLSPSAITNRYVRLGGTIAAPSLEVQPLRAMASAGAAVATFGLSIVAQGLWDRLSAERDVCARALEEARREAE